MYTHTEIKRIGKGLQDCTLPKRDWTHAAHIAAAVWLLDQYGQAAFDMMPDMIRNYNVAIGVMKTATEGYHHTITIASLKAIQSECAIGDILLVDRVKELLVAVYDYPAWLLRHYSKERLFSAQARHHWVEPDLLSLP